MVKLNKVCNAVCVCGRVVSSACDCGVGMETRDLYATFIKSINRDDTRNKVTFISTHI